MLLNNPSLMHNKKMENVLRICKKNSVAILHVQIHINCYN